jgi:hypothetical protein
MRRTFEYAKAARNVAVSSTEGLTKEIHQILAPIAPSAWSSTPLGPHLRIIGNPHPLIPLSVKRRLEMLPTPAHLYPEVRCIASRPAAERIAFIQGDRWINYSRADEALRRMAGLLNCPP